MATQLSIDGKLLKEALRVGGKRSPKAAVTEALREYISKRKKPSIVDMFGTVDFDPAYDYKADRRRGNR